MYPATAAFIAENCSTFVYAGLRKETPREADTPLRTRAPLPVDLRRHYRHYRQGAISSICVYQFGFFLMLNPWILGSGTSQDPESGIASLPGLNHTNWKGYQINDAERGAGHGTSSMWNHNLPGPAQRLEVRRAARQAHCQRSVDIISCVVNAITSEGDHTGRQSRGIDGRGGRREMKQRWREDVKPRAKENEIREEGEERARTSPPAGSVKTRSPESCTSSGLGNPSSQYIGQNDGRFERGYAVSALCVHPGLSIPASKSARLPANSRILRLFFPRGLRQASNLSQALSNATQRVLPEDSTLITKLLALSRKDERLVHCSEHAVSADSSSSVYTWAINWEKIHLLPRRSTVPTLARGIATMEQPSGEHRIVLRASDKVFGIEELPWTTWKSLGRHTVPPYTISRKGCGPSIFIAALTPETLLVASEHAFLLAGHDKYGPHAATGERWLQTQLEHKGRTMAQLASVLWEKNWTAVTDLYGDTGEHIVTYPPELRGLHLCGLNESTAAFRTCPPTEVDAFAAEWGFIRTVSTALPTLAAVRAFANEVDRTGMWDGVAVEGLVVRTRAWPSVPSLYEDPWTTPPYAGGAAFFVEVDTEYALHRDGCAPGHALMRREETQAYTRWVAEELQRDPTAFAEFRRSQGMVAVQKRFFASPASGRAGKLSRTHVLGHEHEGVQRDLGGSMDEVRDNPAIARLVDLLTRSINDPATKNEPPVEQFVTGLFSDKQRTVIEPPVELFVTGLPRDKQRTVIILVGTSGCYKTEIALALSHIFSFPYMQPNGESFTENVQELLRRHDGIIVDGMTHLIADRIALRAAIAQFRPQVHILGLRWPLDRARRALEGLNTRDPEPLTLSEVEGIVNIDSTEELAVAVRRAVRECARKLDLAQPSLERVERALTERYYSATLHPEVALDELLDPVLPFLPEAAGRDVMSVRPHVTVVRQSQRNGEDPLFCFKFWNIALVSRNAQGSERVWMRCAALHEGARALLFRFTLGHVVWNERIMGVTLDALEVMEEGGSREGGLKVVATLPANMRKRLLLTVQMWDKTIATLADGNNLIKAWRQRGDVDGVRSVALDSVVATGRDMRATLDVPAPEARGPRYYALRPQVQLERLLAPVLTGVPFWGALCAEARVAKFPQAVLVHQKALHGMRFDVAAATSWELWRRCTLLAESRSPPLFRLVLGHVVWNKLIMVVTVDALEVDDGAGGLARCLIAELPSKLQRLLHITVGTQDADVGAQEAHNLLEAWRQMGDADGVQSIPLGAVTRARLTARRRIPGT
ncbi:RNA ligase-domain-containing protein [Mycena latifolia]|nr:RNA ligase-domain-containing protein [Mycena latifolia]